MIMGTMISFLGFKACLKITGNAQFVLHLPVGQLLGFIERPSLNMNFDEFGLI